MFPNWFGSFIESIEVNPEAPDRNWSTHSGEDQGSMMHVSESPSEGKLKHAASAAGLKSLQAEKKWVQDWVRDKVSALLADSDNAVKITLMQHNLTRLCLFFGRTGGKYSLLKLGSRHSNVCTPGIIG